MKAHRKILFATRVALISALPAVSAQQGEITVKGEVIQVQQQVRTDNGGEFDQIRIRTRQGEMINLRLGNGSSCKGCVQTGDLIQARVCADSGGQMGQVQKLQLQRGRNRYGYQLQNGGMLRSQQRLGAGSRGASHRGSSAVGKGSSRRGGGS